MDQLWGRSTFQIQSLQISACFHQVWELRWIHPRRCNAIGFCYLQVSTHWRIGSADLERSLVWLGPLLWLSLRCQLIQRWARLFYHRWFERISAWMFPLSAWAQELIRSKRHNQPKHAYPQALSRQRRDASDATWFLLCLESKFWLIRPCRLDPRWGQKLCGNLFG